MTDHPSISTLWVDDIGATDVTLKADVDLPTGHGPVLVFWLLQTRPHEHTWLTAPVRQYESGTVETQATNCHPGTEHAVRGYIPAEGEMVASEVREFTTDAGDSDD